MSQVGDKFILTVCPTEIEQHLIIIDQHAADERVKLEHYLSVLTSKDLQMTATALEPFVALDISEHELVLLKSYVSIFAQFGINYEYNKSGLSQVFITHVPKLLWDKLASEDQPQVKREILIQTVINHANKIHDGKISRFPVLHETHWTKSIRNYPSTLIDLYKSKACRGEYSYIVVTYLTPYSCH